MANVSPTEGITYGFRLIGYAIGVFIVGFVLFAVGAVFLDGGSPVLGGIVFLFGSLTIFAGFLGINYKVIADAVEKGMNASNVGNARAQPQQPQRQATQQQRSTRQQQPGGQQQQQ